MSRRDASLAAALLVAVMASPALGASEAIYGTPITRAEIAGHYFSIPPSGAGLPLGHGTAAQGQVVYANACAACHGDKLQGIAAVGGPALIDGRGTLASPKPVKTVESYWPYATTLFDYVKRAMPFNAPGSLSDEQVYAVVAYILAEDHVIDASETIDAGNLAKIKMPNAEGFTPDPRPETNTRR